MTSHRDRDRRIRRMTDPAEIVRATLVDPAAFKVAVEVLGKLPPSEEAARILADAQAAGSAPLWLVALLLGWNGHSVGYAMALEILRRASDLGTAVPAANALVRIAGERAEPDLRAVVEEVENRRVRRAAAQGLARIATEGVVTYLMDALARGRLQAQPVADALVGAPVAPELLARAMRSEHVETRRMPVMLVANRARTWATAATSGRGDDGVILAELERCARSKALRAALAEAVANEEWDIAWRADRTAIARWLESLGAVEAS